MRRGHGRRREKTPPPDRSSPDLPVLTVESLDQEGRGVGHADGKVVFVEGALPGERVSYASHRRKASYEIADVGAVLTSSVARVMPRCPHFGVCGGCSMQHLEATSQVAVKQRVLEDHLWHIGRVRADRVLPAIHGPSWGYRHRARLSVRIVEKKGGALVGFHERRSSFVADMRECHVVPPHVSALLVPLRGLVESLAIGRRLPQIELAIGEQEVDGRRERETVLVLRVLEPPTAADEALLTAFALEHGVVFWLQPKGPDTIVPLLAGAATELHYDLPEFDVRIHFLPTDFTQVNAQINRVLVGRAVRLLDVQPADRVADLFCGLGNFSLPLARVATRGAVVGVEGSKAMTARAAENARRNGLDDRTSFSAVNLFEVDTAWFEALGAFDRMLIDPPREGAAAVVEALAGLGERLPRRIVYVSCNPATLARDAAVLVREAGYVLAQAGIVNMFPQTSHVESIAVFDRP